MAGRIQTQKLRDHCFQAALEVHGAFVRAAAGKISPNIRIFCKFLEDGRLPDDVTSQLPSLWSTFNLIVPVVSTTFASAGRMLKDMPPESIGWLLVDEAGQALPQAAVGAIGRSRRSVIIGDPMQIEPVVTIPPSLNVAICEQFGVRHKHWTGPHASVQTIADRAVRYSSKIGENRVGAPLLVHRRCSEPMFSIANQGRIRQFDGQWHAAQTFTRYLRCSRTLPMDRRSRWVGEQVESSRRTSGYWIT